MKRIERFLGEIVAWGVAHSSIYGPPIKWPRVPVWAVLAIVPSWLWVHRRSR